MNPFKSERGAAFVLAILLVGLVILGFVAASGQYYLNLVEDGAKNRRMWASYEVSQNFAVEIRRAYDRSNSAITTSCTGSYTTKNLYGYNYCLPNSLCVSNPLGGLDSGAGADQVCWDTTGSDADVAQNLPKWRSHLEARWNQLRYWIGKGIHSLVLGQSGTAFAQAGREDDLPLVIPATTAVDLDTLDCAGGDQIHCQRCGVSTAWGTPPACVYLSICLIPGGCPDPNFRVHQWIGMVRGP